MKISKYNGLNWSETEIPDDIIDAAERVRIWMEANKCVVLCGLTTDKLRNKVSRLEVAVSNIREQLDDL